MAKAPAPTLAKVSIGRGQYILATKKTFKAGDSQMAKFVADGLFQAFSAAYFNDFQKKQAKLVRDIESASKRELNRLIPYVTKSLMNQAGNRELRWGIDEPESDTGLDYFTSGLRIGGKARISPPKSKIPRGTVLWPALSAGSLKGQGSRKKFFSDTGELKSVLRASAASLISRTGYVKVTVKKKKKQIRNRVAVRTALADLDIRIMPSLYPSDLPGLVSGNWTTSNKNMSLERRLGLNPRIVQKLKGHTNPSTGYVVNHRPLLQPVFTYWAMFRVPNAITKAIVRAVTG